MKQKEFKSKEERLQIVMDIIKKLKDLNILGFSGVQEMLSIMKEYVALDITKETGGFSGKIKLQELKREIHYNLPILKNSNPIFVLKSK